VTVLLEVDRAFELAARNLNPETSTVLTGRWKGTGLEEVTRFLDEVRLSFHNILETNWYPVAPKLEHDENYSTTYQDVWNVNVEYHFFITADFTCVDRITGQSRKFSSEEVRIVDTRVYLTIVYEKINDIWRVSHLRPMDQVPSVEVCDRVLGVSD